MRLDIYGVNLRIRMKFNAANLYHLFGFFQPKMQNNKPQTPLCTGLVEKGQHTLDLKEIK